LTSAIDAFEGRVVGTSNIKGAYLHAPQDDFTVIRFIGAQVDIMHSISSEYLQYVVIENGKKVLYLMLNRALYGTVRAVLLWYNLLTSTLFKMGFKLNPYDLCVANSTINGKQCTICYHVDDTKVLHVERKVVEDIFEALQKKFGKMKVVIGDNHDFLRMNLIFRNDRKFSIRMTQLLTEVVEEFGETPTRAVTLARSDLFEVDDNLPLVEERRQKLFHRLVYKIYYCAPRGRKDLQLTTSFLMTRIGKCNERDYTKL